MLLVFETHVSKKKKQDKTNPELRFPSPTILLKAFPAFGRQDCGIARVFL